MPAYGWTVLTWLLPRDWWFSFCPHRQKGWSYPLGLPSKSPQEQGIQHRNVGSSGEGAGFLPVRSSYGWHKSEFLVCEPLPRCEQRPTGPARSNSESVPRALAERPLGGTFLVSVFQGWAETMREMGGAVGGELLALAPLIPSPPTLRLPAHPRHPLWRVPSALLLQSCPSQSPSPSPR